MNHAVVFIINVLITRILGVSNSGHYFNELYLVSFFVFIFSLGLDYSVIAWLSREPHLRAALHRKLILVSVFFIFLLLFSAFVLLPFLPYSFNQTILALILYASGNMMLILFQGLLSSIRKFGLQNIILLSVNVLFSFYLLYLFNENGLSEPLQKVSVGYAIVFFIQGLLMLLFSFKNAKLPPQKINWFPLLKYGTYMMISSVVYFVFLKADNFFVEKYADSSTLSNYIQCGKMGQYFIYFSSILSTSILPYLSSGKNEMSIRQWKKIMTPYIGIIILSAIVLFFTGSFIYPFVFGNGFGEMNHFMQILMPGYVCLGILTLLNSVYIGNKNVKKIFTGDLLGLLFIISMNLIFAPIYGVEAIATISSIAYCLLCIYLFAGFKKQFDQKQKL
jgi:O-antigen/teichoic acid export membrane protein